ncbi:flagellar hook-associated protein FlgL [Halarsenatibacter silvermanii]|uniref:Flagellar hook-associated protein 3 FlgL n=1 Tax=Halarsenatibacter silvermanii TaxID=321763 RepID=A0A1G9M0H6_9FIRM|nr:flagellar hook-associated protein FlgL [Halarsenatibacter silvermanii]SDL67654.1 flagellar hook-associated protein 3 FlgL [Halarsenatibacter silvermanii]
MRITQGVMVNNMKNNLQHNMQRLDDYSQQLSSGQKFRFPSEAPIKAARSMDLGGDIASSEQFEENINRAQAWIETTESAMDDAVNVIHRARELTIQGANDTLTADERENLASEMRQLREELISISETRHGDRHVFSGQRTDEAPFDDEGNFVGDHKNILRQISPGVEMAVNVDGEQAFGSAIDALDNVIDDLEGGSARIYSNQIQSGPLGKDFGDINGEEINMEIEVYDPEAGETESFSIGEADLVEDDEDVADLTRSEFANRVNDKINEELETENERYARLRNNRIEFRSPGTGDEAELSIDFVDDGGDSVDLSESPLGELLFEGSEYAEEDGMGEFRDVNGPRMLGESDIEDFDDALDDNLAMRADLGARMNRLEMTEGRLEDNTINLRELLSENQDTDMAETIMEMRMEESVYQASLATGARIIQPTLVDFLQ